MAPHLRGFSFPPYPSSACLSHLSVTVPSSLNTRPTPSISACTYS
ncbi:TPA_asm: hypothetical protein [Pseudomonas phage vB_PaeS-D14B]|nr:TPA_asm: hypothetical protein [Pseudomonas phage vB_PaeS-D14B]